MGTFSPGSTSTWSAAPSGGSLRSPTMIDRTRFSASYVMAPPRPVTGTEQAPEEKNTIGASGSLVRAGSGPLSGRRPAAESVAPGRFPQGHHPPPPAEPFVEVDSLDARGQYGRFRPRPAQAPPLAQQRGEDAAMLRPGLRTAGSPGRGGRPRHRLPGARPAGCLRRTGPVSARGRAA